MTPNDAAEILRQHNAWRRNNDDDVLIPMADPFHLGHAIDVAVEHLKADEGLVPVAWLVVDAKGRRFTIYNRDLAAAIKQTAEANGSTLTVKSVCEIPPRGWYCTRGADHEGSCAAWPNEPPVQASQVDTFTAAQVDWLMTFNARLIVDGLHPEDARLWAQANDQWDFAADPVAEADSTWQDFFANPDDDGPVDKAPTAEPVAQPEAVKCPDYPNCPNVSCRCDPQNYLDPKAYALAAGAMGTCPNGPTDETLRRAIRAYLAAAPTPAQGKNG